LIAQQQRAALLDGGVAGVGGKPCLPAADLGRADLVDGAIARARTQVVAQPAFCHDEGMGLRWDCSRRER
jgi:hypothetical protein